MSKKRLVLVLVAVAFMLVGFSGSASAVCLNCVDIHCRTPLFIGYLACQEGPGYCIAGGGFCMPGGMAGAKISYVSLQKGTEGRVEVAKSSPAKARPVLTASLIARRTR